MRSERPLAGEYAGISSMPSRCSARPTWVGLSLSTLRVVAGPVGIERAEQAALADHLTERPEARHRAPPSRVDLAGGRPTIRSRPGTHSWRPWCTIMLAPVRAAPGCRAHAPTCARAPYPVVAALAAVLGYQLLVEVLGGEVPVAGVEERKHPRHLVHRRAPRRDPAQAAVVQTLRAIGLTSRQRRKVRSEPRTSAASGRAQRAPINLFELHQSQPLCLLRPNPNPPWLGSFSGQIIWYISRVTDTHHI